MKALPVILDRLVAEGYQFAGWDGSVSRRQRPMRRTAEKMPVNTGYGESWAIVIGINDYAKWPKLHYAVRDAQGVRQALIEKFGFAPERVVSLENARSHPHRHPVRLP